MDGRRLLMQKGRVRMRTATGRTTIKMKFSEGRFTSYIRTVVRFYLMLVNCD